MAAEIESEAKGCLLQWKIENISHCWLKKSKCIQSLSFTVEALEGTDWNLRLFPTGDRSEKTLQFYLYRGPYGPDNLSVKYQLAFLDKDGHILKETPVVPVNYLQKGILYGFNENEAREKVFVTEREKYLPDDTLTVEIKLWGKGAKHIDLNHLYAGRVYEVTRRSFNLRIDNFSTLKSGVINQFRDGSIHFDLVLSEERDFEKNLALKLSNTNKKYFSFKFSLVDSEGKNEDFDTHEYFENDLCTEVFCPLLFTQKLFENKSRYLPNDVLSLDCEYAYSDGSVSYKHCGYGKISSKFSNELLKNRNIEDIGKQEIFNDFNLMYNEALFSDTEIRTSTSTFSAHKAVLSARSPVFRNMFSNDMKEKNNGRVDITDFDDDTIQRMLLYMYTNSLEDLQFESAIKLYAIADKYETLSLKSKCSSFLIKSLCPGNVCDALAMSDLHGDDELRGAAEDYILSQDKEIFNSPDWKDFMKTHSGMAADVMHKKIFS